MTSFSANYSKKQYEKLYSNINKTYKGKNSLKDHIIRKIETSEEYDNSYNDISEETPQGLTINQINNVDLLKNAYQQTLNIGYYLNGIMGENNSLTNYRFYINTPYFDRNSNDDFPLFKINDKRISFISNLVFESLDIFGIKDYNMELLNIIVRIYRPGDVLNFHSDRELFGENIYGIVLHNSDISRGLMLKTKKKFFMLEETEGLIWRLSETSRWEYLHGYSTDFNKKDDFVRISITFRFF
jgi:hypothetical protein